MNTIRPHLLIVGGTGFLGSYLLNNSELKKKYSVEGASRNGSIKLDLSSDSLSELAEYFSLNCPRVVVITAAIADVEACAKDPAGTKRVNVDGIKNILQMALRFSVKPVFFSSDYALGPTKELRLMCEDDEGDPRTEYGRQKLEVEQWIKTNFQNYLIFRTSKLISMNTHPKNILFQILKDLRAKRRVSAINDQWFTPVFIEDIARILSHEEVDSLSGTFHLASKKVYTRYDLALEARQTLQATCDVGPISISELKTKEERPRYNTLNSEKICSRLGFTFTEIKDSGCWSRFFYEH